MKMKWLMQLLGVARSNAELAATLRYSYHRIEDEERDVIYQGQRNLIYYCGDEPMYDDCISNRP